MNPFVCFYDCVTDREIRVMCLRISKNWLIFKNDGRRSDCHNRDVVLIYINCLFTLMLISNERFGFYRIKMLTWKLNKYLCCKNIPNITRDQGVKDFPDGARPSLRK